MRRRRDWGPWGLAVLCCLFAARAAAQVDCGPVDLMQVIDRSGSMDGPQLGRAKDAADYLVTLLEPSADRVGLVSFNVQATLDAPLGGDFATVRLRIDDLVVAGDTAIDSGVVAAQDELRARATARPVMVLFTDGITARELHLRLQAGIARAEGTTIFVVLFESPWLSPYWLALMRDVASSDEHLLVANVADDVRPIMEALRGVICACGDGQLDPPAEACDDGNDIPGDGCTGCQIDPVCGDGVVQSWESCDEGSRCEDGSPCVGAADCVGIGDELCRHRGDVTCTEDCRYRPANCGDGVLQQGEQCDDGNNQSGDGCNALCRFENTCPNGILEPGEQCDDGNLDPGDGCDRCIAECVEDDGGPVVAVAGTVVYGATVRPDSCISASVLEEFYCGRDCNDIDLPSPIELRSSTYGCTAIGYPGGCSAGACVPDDGDRTARSPCGFFCGNGQLDPGEECDDGNTVSGDGCNFACLLEHDCGDGQLDPGEECDDGNTTSGDGCDAVCRLEGCGDGILQPWEQCDDGNNQGGDGCSEVCSLETVCGDGQLDGLELCDDGNQDPSDTCDEHCVPTYCGDALVQTPNGEGSGGPLGDGNEQCDDRNSDPTDLCTSDCVLTSCGDGVVQQPNGQGSGGPADDGVEECDDGNQVDGDGCSGCRIDPLAVSFLSLAARCRADAAEVEWSVGEELGTLAYSLQRSPAEGGPWETLPGLVWATGSGGVYRKSDTAPGPGRRWYRVQEICSEQTCDVSPAVELSCVADTGSAGRARRRSGVSRQRR